MGTKTKDANSLRYCIGGGMNGSTLRAGPGRAGPGRAGPGRAGPGRCFETPPGYINSRNDH